MNSQQWVRRLYTAAALLTGSFCANSAWAVAITSDMNVLPHNDSPAWSSAGQQSLASVGGGILRINDASTSDFLQYSQFLNSQDTTFEARVKVASSSPDSTGVASYMALADAANFGVFLDLRPDAVRLVERFNTSWDVVGTHNTDMTSDFRTLRMTQDDTTTKVYLDGAEIFSYLQQDDFSSHVAFGSLTMNGQSDASWDYVAFTGEGAFGHDEMDFEVDGNDQGGGGDQGGGDGGSEIGRTGALSNPEPTSALLLVLGAAFFSVRRRQRKRLAA